MVVEACKEILPEESKNNIILKYVMDYFEKSIVSFGVKSTVKGNALELVILAFLLEKDFQGKSLYELSFINGNLPMSLPTEVETWMKAIKFCCEDFGSQSSIGMTDTEILEAFSNFILKPSDIMHPDGIMVFKYDDNFYFLIFSDKTSAVEISSETLLKNLYSGDVDLFYFDKYAVIKVGPEKPLVREGLRNPPKITEHDVTTVKGELRQQFFDNFKPEKIKGVIRVLFELDTNETVVVSKHFKGKIGQCDVDEVIIPISTANLKTFISENNPIYHYFQSYFAFCRKRKRDDAEVVTGSKAQNVGIQTGPNLYEMAIGTETKREKIGDDSIPTTTTTTSTSSSSKAVVSGSKTFSHFGRCCR